jgi:hypothetical protein
MDYIWFWTFWHWSKESFRGRMLLRGPLHGIAGHWDEWFRHEASETDRRSIEKIGKTESGQRRFIFWLCRHWASEATSDRNRLIPRFVLGQLALVPPFNSWPAFARYRTNYGVQGIHAVILADKSQGEPQDIRDVEALILPPDADSTASMLVAEGFQAETSDLATSLQAAKRLLSGKGLWMFLASWLVWGRRPYPRWLFATLFLGWVTVGGLILFLLFGPEPGDGLFLLELVLVALWFGLILIASMVGSVLIWRAWRAGAVLRTRLENSQVRLRMNGGLTLKGGSAGLPFCLNLLSSLYRAHPEDARSSWLWQRFFRRLRSEGGSWAATGVLTEDGSLVQVVLGPKLRACFKQERIKQMLTPRQPEANTKAADSAAKASTEAIGTTVAAQGASSRIQLGFAAEKPRLRLHQCHHIARAVMVLGGFTDRWQAVANVFSVIVTAIMLAALPDLRSILLPHPAPIAVSPASSSPYDLWVSLDTKHPEYLSVVLESDYWSNRRAEVRRHDDLIPSVRAVIPFHRLIGTTTANEEDGVVWIERRRRFLAREFLPGERVGRYSIPYLSKLGHE